MTTPCYGHQPLLMRRLLPDLTDELEESIPWTALAGGGRLKRMPSQLQQVGDFHWDLRDGRRQLVCAIPCDENPKGWIYSAWSIDYRNTSGAQWAWDGDEDCPTLVPSVHAVGEWHGWIQKGMLIEA